MERPELQFQTGREEIRSRWMKSLKLLVLNEKRGRVKEGRRERLATKMNKYLSEQKKRSDGLYFEKRGIAWKKEKWL